jgi:hypothetical protein
VLHKDYDRKGSLEKKIQALSLKGIDAKTELIGGKLPFVK